MSNDLITTEQLSRHFPMALRKYGKGAVLQVESDTCARCHCIFPTRDWQQGYRLGFVICRACGTIGIWNLQEAERLCLGTA